MALAAVVVLLAVSWPKTKLYFLLCLLLLLLLLFEFYCHLVSPF